MPKNLKPDREDPLNIPKARDLIIAARMLVTSLRAPRDEADVAMWIDQVEKALDAIFRGHYPEGVEPIPPEEYSDAAWQEGRERASNHPGARGGRVRRAPA